MQLLLTLTEQSLFACTIKLRMVASKTYTVLLCGVDVARSITYGMVGHLLVKGEKASYTDIMQKIKTQEGKGYIAIIAFKLKIPRQGGGSWHH